MAARLSDRLLATGLIPTATVRAAIARQAVYGGALDTALLELDALDEGTLWGELAAATELRDPGPRALRGAARSWSRPTARGARSRRRLVGALPRRAGGAQGWRAADPVRRAGRARRDRGGDAGAGNPFLALRGARDLDGGRPAGDLRPSDGAAAGAPLRARRGGRAGPALASGEHARPPPTPPEPPVEIPPRLSATGAASARGGVRDGAARRQGGSRRAGDGAAHSPGAPSKSPGPGPCPSTTRARCRASSNGSSRGATSRRRTQALVAITKQDFGAQGEALGALVEAARGRRSDRLAVRGAVAQDRRDPGRRRAGAARADRRVFRLRTSICRATRARRRAPAGRPGGPNGDRSRRADPLRTAGGASC